MEDEVPEEQLSETIEESTTSLFEPKILGLLCNSAFFFGAKFSSGSGLQRKTWGKKKLALTCSNFAFNGRWEVV
jgi:hypothetical protein